MDDRLFEDFALPRDGGSDEQVVMSPLKQRAPILKEKKLDRNGRVQERPL
jgi:hypothetical protein